MTMKLNKKNKAKTKSGTSFSLKWERDDFHGIVGRIQKSAFDSILDLFSPEKESGKAKRNRKKTASEAEKPVKRKSDKKSSSQSSISGKKSEKTEASSRISGREKASADAKKCSRKEPLQSAQAKLPSRTKTKVKVRQTDAVITEKKTKKIAERRTAKQSSEKKVKRISDDCHQKTMTASRFSPIRNSQTEKCQCLNFSKTKRKKVLCMMFNQIDINSAEGKKHMSDLFFRLLSELQENNLKNSVKSDGVNSPNDEYAHYELPKTKPQESSNENALLDIDLDLNLDDIPMPRQENTISEDSDLPVLPTFWPGKTAQYWIPSDENQNGKHLALDLTYALLGQKEIASSNNVPLLFYHGHPDKPVCVLCFKNPQTPFIRHCEQSIENELYNKSLEERRVLLVPTFKIAKNKLLILLPPVPNIGVLEKKTDVSWMFEYIPDTHERCVFFEEGNSPNTLRQSRALSEFAQDGRLYIVMCAGELLASANMRTDINSPKKAVKKMFDKQLETLCPGTWNRLLCDSQKNDFPMLVKELLNPADESGIYHLRKIQIAQNIECKLTPFSKETMQFVIAELKNIYLEILPDFVQLLKEKFLADKTSLKNLIVLSVLADHIVLSVTKICYEIYTSKKDAFPELEKTKIALKASLLYLEFKTAGKIANNFIADLRNLESRLTAFSAYDEAKHYLWNYFPTFDSICRKELEQLHERSLRLQKAFAEITAKECGDDKNDQ